MNVAFYRILSGENATFTDLVGPLPWGPPLPPCAAGRVSYPRESFRGNPSQAICPQQALSSYHKSVIEGNDALAAHRRLGPR